MPAPRPTSVSVGFVPKWSSASQPNAMPPPTQTAIMVPMATRPNTLGFSIGAARPGPAISVGGRSRTRTADGAGPGQGAKRTERPHVPQLIGPDPRAGPGAPDLRTW